MSKPITIHTSRTIMFAELEKVMACVGDDRDFTEALSHNVTGKKSSSGIQKTARYLKTLYRFDLQYPPFAVLSYFWQLTDNHEKPLLALLFAVNHDKLLAESVEAIMAAATGEKVSIELIEAVIEKQYPQHYSANTRRSLAQNIASSWKQAGFITGKVKNLRSQPEISHRVACFAFLLAYLAGNRSDFIWNNIGVKALGLSESRLRELAVECAQRDMMQYHYAGNVTAIQFTKLLQQIGIHGHTH